MFPVSCIGSLFDSRSYGYGVRFGFDFTAFNSPIREEMTESLPIYGDKNPSRSVGQRSFIHTIYTMSTILSLRANDSEMNSLTSTTSADETKIVEFGYFVLHVRGTVSDFSKVILVISTSNSHFGAILNVPNGH